MKSRCGVLSYRDRRDSEGPLRALHPGPFADLEKCMYRTGTILQLLLMAKLCIFNCFLRLNHMNSGFIKAPTIFYRGQNVYAVGNQ